MLKSNDKTLCKNGVIRTDTKSTETSFWHRTQCTNIPVHFVQLHSKVNRDVQYICVSNTNPILKVLSGPAKIAQRSALVDIGFVLCRNGAIRTATKSTETSLWHPTHCTSLIHFVQVHSKVNRDVCALRSMSKTSFSAFCGSPNYSVFA